jgi:hypothetical protein
MIGDGLQNVWRTPNLDMSLVHQNRNNNDEAMGRLLDERARERETASLLAREPRSFVELCKVWSHTIQSLQGEAVTMTQNEIIEQVMWRTAIFSGVFLLKGRSVQIYRPLFVCAFQLITCNSNDIEKNSSELCLA